MTSALNAGRDALTADIHRTSLEMGNSPTMITKHYLQLATNEQAEAWFGVRPTPSTNAPATPNPSIRGIL